VLFYEKFGLDAHGNVLFSHRGRVYSLEDLVQIRTVWRSGGCIVQPEVLFPRKLALAVGGLDPENHYTMDYELWGQLFLAGAEIRYTDTPFGMSRKHPHQKTHNMLRQTRALLDTAAKLVLQADLFPNQTKDEMLQDLRTYGEAYEDNYWKGTGRLARLGLPRVMVTGLRRLKTFLLKAVPFGATREQA
jgi:hypothetical protein